MLLPEENLALLLLYSITVGAFLGVLWDIFRILRIAVYGKQKKMLQCPIKLPSDVNDVKKALSFYHRQNAFSFAGISIFISDLLFSITAALTVILLLFHINGGEIRGFALFGALIGFIIYYFTVGRLTVFFSDLIIKATKRLIFFIFSVTFKPLLMFFRKILHYILGLIYKRIRKNYTKKYLKKQLRNASNGFSIFENN